MLKSTFTALAPRQTNDDEVNWIGFNKSGKLAYGLRYYNQGTKVKVYSVSIFGENLHEIAAIEFAGFDICYDTFYHKRQEIVWLRKVEPGYVDEPLSASQVYILVIFNVEFGLVKRYYGKFPELKFCRTNLITADDRLILRNADGNPNPIYEIELNQADNTFSLKLVGLMQNRVSIPSANLVYYRSRLVNCCHNTQRIRFYDFQTNLWYKKEMFYECAPPMQSDSITSISGEIYFCVIVGSSGIRTLKFDADTLTWTEVFAGIPPNPLDLPNHHFQWIASGNCQTLCHFWQKAWTMEEFINVRIEVFCREMKLRDLCLRALWPHVNRLFPEYENLTYHEMCEHLRLSSILNVDEYFGKKVTGRQRYFLWTPLKLAF